MVEVSKIDPTDLTKMDLQAKTDLATNVTSV